MTEIYLDNNSTTPIDPSVARVIADCYADGYLNPASQHRAGQRARGKLEQVRRRIVEILGGNVAGMETDQLIFTSGGTESNNLALMGLMAAAGAKGRLLVSAIEHPSIIGAGEQLQRMGYTVEKIPVDRHGVCRMEELKRLLEQPTTLVSLMLANNETGVIQPVKEAAELCRQNNVLLHVDAVQAVGKLPLNFRELGMDAISLTAHKFHGPRGIGGLLLKHGVSLQPILFGGFQQMALRPGTEDVGLAAGMLQALEVFHSDPDQRYQHLVYLRDLLQSELTSRFDQIVVNGGAVERTPHTLNFSFPGIDRQSFLLAADMNGLAISTGSACASGSSEPSPVLMAMGLEKDIIEGSIRVSLGATNTEAEIHETIARISRILVGLKASK